MPNKHYSKKMLEAWEKTKAAYEQLLWGCPAEIGYIPSWYNYGSSWACRLCIVCEQQCHRCVLNDGGGTHLDFPCTRKGKPLTTLMALQTAIIDCELGEGYIATAEVMRAAAARYEWLRKRAWQNGVE